MAEKMKRPKGGKFEHKTANHIFLVYEPRVPLQFFLEKKTFLNEHDFISINQSYRKGDLVVVNDFFPLQTLRIF